MRGSVWEVQVEGEWTRGCDRASATYECEDQFFAVRVDEVDCELQDEDGEEQRDHDDCCCKRKVCVEGLSSVHEAMCSVLLDLHVEEELAGG